MQTQLLSLDCEPALLSLLEIGDAHGYGLALDLMQSLGDEAPTTSLSELAAEPREHLGAEAPQTPSASILINSEGVLAK